jgi:hypothetical protein
MPRAKKWRAETFKVQFGNYFFARDVFASLGMRLGPAVAQVEKQP